MRPTTPSQKCQPCASPWEHSAAPLAGKGNCQPHRDTLLETKGPQWEPHLPWHPGLHPGWVAKLQRQGQRAHQAWPWVFQPSSPIPKHGCRCLGQGHAPVPPSPCWALPAGAAFPWPHSPRADMILLGHSGRRIPRQPPHHCPLVFREGLPQPRVTSAAPLAALPMAAGWWHRTVGGVWDRHPQASTPAAWWEQ